MNGDIVLTLQYEGVDYLGIRVLGTHEMARPSALSFSLGATSRRTMTDFHTVREYGRFGSNPVFQQICQATPVLNGQSFENWVDAVVQALAVHNVHQWEAFPL